MSEINYLRYEVDEDSMNTVLGLIALSTNQRQNLRCKHSFAADTAAKTALDKILESICNMSRQDEDYAACKPLDW